jgi:hypothetical protein
MKEFLGGRFNELLLKNDRDECLDQGWTTESERIRFDTCEVLLGVSTGQGTRYEECTEVPGVLLQSSRLIRLVFASEMTSCEEGVR